MAFLPKIIGNSTILKVLFCILLMLRDARTTKFRIVHGFWAMPQGFAAVLAGRLLGAPSIVSVLGGDVVYLPAIRYGTLRSFLHRSIVRWTIGRAGHVTLLTHFQKVIMEAGGISSPRNSTILFGADVKKFLFRPHPPSSTLRLGYIGNLNRVKDPFTLIKTFSILRKKVSCTLTIVGPDVLKGEVQQYAQSLGVFDAIQWMGKTSHESIPEILSSIDILLLTSLYEGEAVVVMEAFASGVIVAGTKVGLLADVGEERTTVMPGDAEALAEKICSLTSQPEVVRELQEKNRKIAEKYTSDATGAEFKKLYEELMG